MAFAVEYLVELSPDMKALKSMRGISKLSDETALDFEVPFILWYADGDLEEWSEVERRARAPSECGSMF